MPCRAGKDGAAFEHEFLERPFGCRVSGHARTRRGGRGGRGARHRFELPLQVRIIGRVTPQVYFRVGGSVASKIVYPHARRLLGQEAQRAVRIAPDRPFLPNNLRGPRQHEGRPILAASVRGGQSQRRVSGGFDRVEIVALGRNRPILVCCRRWSANRDAASFVRGSIGHFERCLWRVPRDDLERARPILGRRVDARKKTNERDPANQRSE